MRAFSTRCMTPDDWRTLRYFTPSEFTHPERMGWEFMKWLDEVRHIAGVPMFISSSARSIEHNAAVGGAMNSAHCDAICEAVDIRHVPTPDDPHWNRARFAIVSAALTLGCIRLGVYPGDGSLHLDRTEARRPAPCLWIQVDNPAHA